MPNDWMVKIISDRCEEVGCISSFAELISFSPYSEYHLKYMSFLFTKMSFKLLDAIHVNDGFHFESRHLSTACHDLLSALRVWSENTNDDLHLKLSTDILSVILVSSFMILFFCSLNTKNYSSIYHLLSKSHNFFSVLLNTKTSLNMICDTLVLDLLNCGIVNY
jgi:hypothetical protein